MGRRFALVTAGVLVAATANGAGDEKPLYVAGEVFLRLTRAAAQGTRAGR